jgi:hypothetical protein
MYWYWTSKGTWLRISHMSCLLPNVKLVHSLNLSEASWSISGNAWIAVAPAMKQNYFEARSARPWAPPRRKSAQRTTPCRRPPTWESLRWSCRVHDALTSSGSSHHWWLSDRAASGDGVLNARRCCRWRSPPLRRRGVATTDEGACCRASEQTTGELASMRLKGASIHFRRLGGLDLAARAADLRPPSSHSLRMKGWGLGDF